MNDERDNEYYYEDRPLHDDCPWCGTLPYLEKFSMYTRQELIDDDLAELIPESWK